MTKKVQEDAPTNCAGGGNVAGIGAGPMGEPGIDKKRKKIIFGIVKRKRVEEMAIIGNLIRQKQNQAAADARDAKAIKRDFGAFVPLNQIWTKQSVKAAHFKDHGWIAHSLLRWQKPDGTMVAWGDGRTGDALHAAAFALKKADKNKTK